IVIFASLFLGAAKTMLVAAAVFIPFERLATLHPAQRVFPKGWATDVLTGVTNSLLLFAVLVVLLGSLDALASMCAPGLRSWVATRPLWAQAVLAVVIGDLGNYLLHRAQHTVPSLWK